MPTLKYLNWAWFHGNDTLNCWAPIIEVYFNVYYSGLGVILSHGAPHPYLKGTPAKDFIQSLAEQPLLQRQAESAGVVQPGEAKALGRPYSA